MKTIALSIAILATGFIFAQEKISPLQINQTIYKQQQQTRATALTTIDSTFIYEFTTLSLADVQDDFSTDKFEQFDAEPLEGGVTSVLYYRLMDATNTIPLNPTLMYCDSAYAYHDTVKIDEIGAVLETVRSYPFTPFDIYVNNLCEYPVEGVLNEGVFQECYALIDSIINGVLDDDQDTIWYNVDPFPYLQDSARVFTKVVTDPNTLWEDNFACHNYTFAVDPWSLGVATFDGVDENGYPYAIGDDGAHGIADYMTSRPIDLSTPDGIVYLTMIYQAKGHGNMPDAFDSLVLEIYSPELDGWYREWAVSGSDAIANVWDTLYHEIPTGFYEDGFQFRFKNYASLSGALDHWHIDYLSLSVQEPGEESAGSFGDLAISEPVKTLLKDYTAVPWDHYKNNASGNEYMLDDIEFRIFNSFYTTPEIEISSNFSGGDWAVWNGGVLQGGAPFAITVAAISPEVNLIKDFTDCAVPGAVDYFFDPLLGGDQQAFDVGFKFTTSASPTRNFTEINDTTSFTQRFDNYYAYDDGSAEAAYGIEGEGSLMAYRFEAYEAGRLTGILMQFQPSVTDLSGEVFLLTVWEEDPADLGKPGEIIYQDDYFESHTPEYSGSKEGFRYYEFKNMDHLNAEDTTLTVGKIFFVGWQNISSLSLNIGLDWNINNGDKVFRNTAGVWLSSSFEMSLLIRPVFSTGLDYTLELAEDGIQEEITLYPNPTNDAITISGLSGDYELRIFDMSGRMVTSVQNQHQVNVSDLESGLYLVDVRNSAGEPIFSSKLIKK